MTSKKEIGFGEFVSLMALYVAMVAMSIDTVLPALGLMGHELGVTHENQTQYIIGFLFLGLTFGQIIYGAISDSFGRKNTVYVGLAIFMIGNVLSLSTSNLEMMLFGRFLQGFGAASPRTMSITITRDLYQGREMARVTSLIMTIFIGVPVLAPSFGQLILLVASWHSIFYFFIFAASAAALWTHLRLPETLKRQDRKTFNLKSLWQSFRIVMQNRITLGYTICAGIVFSALIGYLNCSRQIFQDYFGAGQMFAVYFGISALAIGAASITNSIIVRRFGMKVICHYGLAAMTLTSVLFLPVVLIFVENTPLWAFVVYISVTFFCMGMLFGNLNAMAMEPMGHYAGMASSVVGSISSAISLAIGTLIGQSYDNTLIPVICGFVILCAAAFLLQLILGKIPLHNER